MNRSDYSYWRTWLGVGVLVGMLCGVGVTAQLAPGVPKADAVLRLWPDGPPGAPMEVGPEQDFTKPDDRLIAGRRIIKWGNVAQPELHVYLPPEERRNGTGVVICPGGGFSILAWDLEGTEVAEWLNGHGVAGIVLKYRVPTRQQDPRWLPPVQDAQRALSLSRHHAGEWGLDKNRLGILGFSAGGATAALASLFEDRRYERQDVADDEALRPNFSVLVYTGALADAGDRELKEFVADSVSDQAPPTFLVHAQDDRVPVENSVLLFSALKRVGVPAEMHVYSEGGHGYGLRETAQPVTRWHHRCTAWMQVNGWLESGKP